MLLFLIPLLALATTQGNFPATLTELYCRNNDFLAERCRHSDLEDTLLMKMNYSYDQAQTIQAEELCQKAGQTADACLGKNRTYAICVLLGRTPKECNNATVAALICTKAGKSWDDCQSVKPEQAVCVGMGYTLSECDSVSEAEVLCLNIRRDRDYCKNVTPTQLKCVAENKSKEQLKNCK